MLAPYLPDGWRETLTEPNITVRSSPIYRNLLSSGTTVTDVAGLAPLFADGRRERIVLSSDTSVLATANPNHFIAEAVAEATNRWTEDEWLDQDHRLHGLVVAVASKPEAAAAEIRRSGQHPRMVGVLVGATSLGVPLGHPVYRPILEAAVEVGLPLVLQAGIDANEHAIPSPVAGGLPATAGEYRALAWQGQSAHVSSLILQGVFDLYPTLRVLLLGAGVLWLPGHFWHLDHRFTVTRGEARWLKKRPIDYIDHFQVATYRLDRPPNAEAFVRALSVIPGIEKRFMYASGYPDDAWSDSDTAVDDVPEAWRAGVLRENALSFFRWPGADAPAATTQATHVGEQFVDSR